MKIRQPFGRRRSVKKYIARFGHHPFGNSLAGKVGLIRALYDAGKAARVRSRLRIAYHTLLFHVSLWRYSIKKRLTSLRDSGKRSDTGRNGAVE